MNLHISGKHMNVGESLTSRIEERLDDAVTKYFAGGYSGKVVLEKQGSRYECECLVHLDSSADMQGTAHAPDPTAAFEMAADRIEKRLRRYKRRLKDHHANNSKAERMMAAYAIVESPETEEEMPEDYNPTIIAEQTTSIDTQTVAQAVMKLDLSDHPVLVFQNAGSGKTNIVYRRQDGNIGWIDPS